jgi:hypothetical protein
MVQSCVFLPFPKISEVCCMRNSADYSRHPAHPRRRQEPRTKKRQNGQPRRTAVLRIDTVLLGAYSQHFVLFLTLVLAQ